MTWCFARVKFVHDVSRRFLFREMALGAADIAGAAAHLREALPGQMAHVENVLNSPC
jgi:hypothetical protein